MLMENKIRPEQSRLIFRNSNVCRRQSSTKAPHWMPGWQSQRGDAKRGGRR